MSGETVNAAAMAEQWKGTLVELLGIDFVELGKERVVATLAVRDALRTVGGALHGGTLMAFADTLGAVATVLNLLWHRLLGGGQRLSRGDYVTGPGATRGATAAGAC